MCDFNSLNYTCVSWSRWLPPFLWNLETDISDPFEDYGAKGNLLRYKGERSFLRNFFVFCEIISQSYSFPLKKPFAKTVLVELAKWYLEAHRGLWWKRKYPQMKSGKKLSEKLLSVLLIHLTELHLYFVHLFASLISLESENRYFGSLWRLWGQRKYPLITKGKKLSEKLLCVLWNNLTELQLSPQEAFRSDSSCGIGKVIFGSP